MGRPSKFTQKIADEICDRLIKPESLRFICKDEKMPSMSMVFRWLNDHKSFREQYARAREIQADVIAEETHEIVDDGSNDWMTIQRGEQEIDVVNHEYIARSRLRFDQRRWWLSKLAPKKYGDKIEHEVSGDVEVKVTIGGNAKDTP